MASDKLVTGNALNEILIATKNYIDSDFMEVRVEDVEGLPSILWGQNDVDSKEVDKIIAKYFKIKDDN